MAGIPSGMLRDQAGRPKTVNEGVCSFSFKPDGLTAISRWLRRNATTPPVLECKGIASRMGCQRSDCPQKLQACVWRAFFDTLHPSAGGKPLAEKPFVPRLVARGNISGWHKTPNHLNTAEPRRQQPRRHSNMRFPANADHAIASGWEQPLFSLLWQMP